jgi:hypothetical protein
MHTAAELYAAAAADAQRFYGDGAGAARRPPRRHWRAPHWAGALLLCLGALGAASALHRADPKPPAPPSMAPSDHPASLWMSAAPPASPEDASIGQARGENMPPPSLDIERRGGELRIDAHRASRLQAAQRLAALSGSQLLGMPDALAQAPPLTLHWQGPDARAAWSALLGDDVSHALQCDAGACRVWVAATAGAAAP